MRFGPFELDLRSRELRKGATRLRVPDQSIQILAALLAQAGELVTRDQLRERLWPSDTFVDFEHGLNAAVRRLRAALNDSAESPRFIETLPRRGYRFIGTVQQDPSPSATATPNSEVVAASEPQAAAASDAAVVSEGRGRRRTWAWAALAFAMAAAAGIGVWAAATRGRATGGTREVRSIAVLPLRNLSDASQEYLSDGITDGLITTLAQIKALRVVSVTSIMRYKNRQVPLRQIARDLGVDAVIDGSVQRAGDRVRVSAQLIDARTDSHLWAHAYEERLADVLALQSELARTIANQVEIRLSQQETKRLSQTYSVNPEALEEVLRGQVSRFRLEETRRALTHFERAVTLAPQFAPAYAGLALTWDQLNEPGAATAARAAALRAVELDPDLSDGHAALASVKYRAWDWEGGEAESRLALEGNPGALDGCYCYAMALMVTGRMSEAQQIGHEAVLRNPLSGPAHFAKAFPLFFARRYDEAIAAFRRGLEVDPAYTGNLRILAQALIASGRAPEAVRLLEPQAGKSPLTGLNLAVAYAYAGRGPEALRLLARLEGANAAPEANLVARLYLALGDRAKSLQLLEASVDAHEVRAPYLLHPAYDPLRLEPRFRALVARIRFPRQFEAFESTIGRVGK